MDTPLNMSVFIIHMYIAFVVRHLDQYYKWTKFKCITLRRLLKIIYIFSSLKYVSVMFIMIIFIPCVGYLL